MMKLNRASRKAAGQVCLTGFHQLNTVSASTLVLRKDDFPGALTSKEQEYLDKLRMRIHEDGELVRKFGQRLRGYS